MRGVEALETLKELVSYGPSLAQLQVSFYNELQLLATPARRRASSAT